MVTVKDLEENVGYHLKYKSALSALGWKVILSNGIWRLGQDFNQAPPEEKKIISWVNSLGVYYQNYSYIPFIGVYYPMFK